jgi:hypothetical protein
VCVALAGACLVLVGGCGGSGRTEPATRSTETATRSTAGSTQPQLGCKETGIRYAGKTVSGVEVCFTLTLDGKGWLEIGFRLLRGKGCPNPPAGIYLPEPFDATNPVRLDFANGDFITGRIRGERASGVIKQADFCRGTKLDWSARAAEALPAQALRNLEHPSTEICEKPGIRYAGKTAQGSDVCFTLKAGGRRLVESGWSCPDLQGGTVLSGYQGEVEASGHFDNPDGLSGTIRGTRASGVLSDLENCTSTTWTARHTP